VVALSWTGRSDRSILDIDRRPVSGGASPLGRRSTRQ
jgi:hypothetical protein